MSLFDHFFLVSTAVPDMVALKTEPHISMFSFLTGSSDAIIPAAPMILTQQKNKY